MKKNISTNALRALFYEAITGPKPGLVDPIDNSSHPDMDIYMFIDSSISLQNYLQEAEKVGHNFQDSDLTKMFTKLREKGLIAEKEMAQATNGINTHKGAIFALGICTCAESYVKQNGGNVFDIIRQMTHGLVEHDFKNLNDNQKLTAGQKQFLKYGLGGARQEAEAGHPIVEDVALPFLKNAKGDKRTRILDTFMKIASLTADSTLIKRAKTTNVIEEVQRDANHYLELGGFANEDARIFLNDLNKKFAQHKWSLGGCADLLIITIFFGLESDYL